MLGAIAELGIYRAKVGTTVTAGLVGLAKLGPRVTPLTSTGKVVFSLAVDTLAVGHCVRLSLGLDRSVAKKQSLTQKKSKRDKIEKNQNGLKCLTQSHLFNENFETRHQNFENGSF